MAPFSQKTIPDYDNHTDCVFEVRKNVKSIPSLIKWTGSKRSQAQTIASYFPPYKRYFEPFLGGGSVLFLAARPGSVAGDIYEPLVQLWELVQREPRNVIEDYAEQWHQLQNDFPDYYYHVRDRFNEKKQPLDLNFLSRTCVNGIIRFNSVGEFNNSLHVTRRGMTPERFERIVMNWSNRIQGVIFVCQDYLATILQTSKDDFIYFDPPYAGNKQRYINSIDLEVFIESLYELNDRGVRWALSFDGQRGDADYQYDLPKDLYERHILIGSGNSAVKKVLSGPIEEVRESLYLNY